MIAPGTPLQARRDGPALPVPVSRHGPRPPLGRTGPRRPVGARRDRRAGALPGDRGFGQGARAAGAVPDPADLAREQFSRGRGEPGRRPGDRAVHAGNRPRARAPRPVRSGAGDPACGASARRPETPVRQSRSGGGGLQRWRGPRDELARRQRRPAARDPRVCGGDHRRYRRGLARRPVRGDRVPGGRCPREDERTDPGGPEDLPAGHGLAAHPVPRRPLRPEPQRGPGRTVGHPARRKFLQVARVAELFASALGLCRRDRCGAADDHRHPPAQPRHPGRSTASASRPRADRPPTRCVGGSAPSAAPASCCGPDALPASPRANRKTQKFPSRHACAFKPPRARCELAGSDQPDGT